MLAGCSSEGGFTPDGLTQEPIVGGQPDSTSHAVVGILTREGELCSGSLILPNLVLTAHHCVADISGNGESVQCGVSTFGQPHPASDFGVTWYDNLRGAVPDNSVFYVSSVRVPPNSSAVCGNDVALLELSSNVPADQATPLEPRLDTAPMNNEAFDAVGYGLTNPNDTAGTTAGQRMRFNDAKVTCVGSACGNLGGTANEWAGQSPVCSGDSGGPALDKAGKVIGATSRGPQDCNFAIYSGVTPWKSFITDAATTASTDGGYTPPGWVTGMPDDGGMPSAGSPGMPSAGSPGMSSGGNGATGGRSGIGSGGAPNAGGATMHAGGMTGGAGRGQNGGNRAGAGGASPGSGGAGNSGGMRARGGAPNGGSPALHGAGTPGSAGATSNGMPLMDGGVPMNDAGTQPTKNGAAGSSSGSVDTGGNDTPQAPGCGCRTTTSDAHAGFGAWSLFLAALVTATRRRRKSST